MVCDHIGGRERLCGLGLGTSGVVAVGFAFVGGVVGYIGGMWLDRGDGWGQCVG